MKKLLIAITLAIFVICSNAQKPGTWSVISPEGVYYQDSPQANNPLRGKVIDDMTITTDGDLWIAANNNVYNVKASESGLSLSFNPIPSVSNMKLVYGKSKIRPMIFAETNNGVGVMLSMAVLSINDSDGRVIKTNPDADDIEGYEFDELTNVYSSQYGFAMSGKIKNVPGIAFWDAGLDYMYPTEETIKKLGIKSSFAFYDLNVDKDKVKWALGGTEKTHLWTLSGGKVNPVDFPHPILDIAVDNNGRLVIATPTSIVNFDKNGTITPILETGASFVAFDNAGVIWYVPATDNNEETKEETNAPASGMKLSDMMKAAKAAAKQPAVAASEQTATPALLVRHDPATGKSISLTADNSMIKGKVHKILSDRENNKYILAGGEQKEIYIFKEPIYTGKWTAINPLFDDVEALNTNYWEATCTKQDGSFHAVNRIQDDNTRISIFSGGQWTRQPYQLGDAKLLFTLSDIAFAGENMYAATNNYLYALNNGKLAQVSGIDQKALSQRILALTTGSDNKLWIGSADGLASYDGSSFTYFGKKYTQGPASVRVLSLCSSGDKVFVGTVDGLSVCEQGNWTSFDKKTGLENNRVNALAADAGGRIFVGTVTAFGVTDVLNIFENGKLSGEKIPQKIYINQMAVDSNNNLWIAGNNELVCRKANGEFVIYNDTPLSRGYLIRNIAVVNNEVHISASKDIKVSQPATTAASSEFPARISKGLSAFDPVEQVFVMKID